MEKEYESSYHAIERHHFWFKARQHFILQVLKKATLNNHAAILDVGCSSGAVLEFLKTKGFDNCTGIDISNEAVQNGKNRKLTIVQGSADQLPFSHNHFDCVIASDIIEHVQDDQQVISEIHRVLKTNGIAIIFVPAFHFLWSHHDVINKHYRRYTLTDITTKLAQEGFVTTCKSYWNFFLFIPHAIITTMSRLLNLRPAHGNLRMPIKPFNILFETLLKWENNCIVRGISFPFGISCAVLVQKKGDN